MTDPKKPSVTLESLREFKAAQRQWKGSRTKPNRRLKTEALVRTTQNHTMVAKTDKDIKTVKCLAKLGWKGSVGVKGNMKLAALMRKKGFVLQKN